MYQSVTSFSLSFLSCCLFFCTFFFVNSSIGDICEVLTSPVPAFLDHLTLFSFIGLTFVRPIKVDIEESVLSRCYFLSFFSLSLLVSLSPFTTWLYCERWEPHWPFSHFVPISQITLSARKDVTSISSLNHTVLWEQLWLKQWGWNHSPQHRWEASPWMASDRLRGVTYSGLALGLV